MSAAPSEGGCDFATFTSSSTYTSVDVQDHTVTNGEDEIPRVARLAETTARTERNIFGIALLGQS